ncbi:SusC/RagA family TonB-linked outer membrane protein [Tenacibaculum sp. SG-28]|uniref:SusC/RagA family TonB-linked outer membrane protein n=1 Tax=Tenacibaculum sp. SG-28 TaxID=754426 RepID=UPI000CF441AB|nr:SusC/RagA family TonB-linked outer membrane protein [Tenacibaculum sp. SG-28]PQJ20655.1 SusC/RagA family TonB-linked outer membrane protein [Tenacibaculum sp. SG-28]
MKTKFNGILTLFLAFIVQVSFAQEKIISGNVSDESGPLPGVTILLKGTSKGTETDFDGNYSIKAKTGDVLVYSFVGMTSVEKTVGSTSKIDIEMQSDNMLEEVVVTALGISKKEKAIGYAVQQVDGEQLNQTKETNIVNALQGQVAGVQIQGSPSALGGSSRITIRGSNSFLGNNQPLFVVDGVPIDNANYASNSQQRGFGGGSYDYGNGASDIDPSNIETMSVLKGAAASALYGSRGANGVILITTKSGRGVKGIGVSFDTAVTFDNVANLIPIQQMYGGGSIYSDVDAQGFTVGRNGFKLFTQDGVEYLAPNYGKDGSWGPKYNPNILVRHWDSWDENSSNYKEVRPWVAPKNSYEDFFDTGLTLTNSIAFTGSNEKGNFRASYTNLSQKGTTPNAKLERNTINLNSGYNFTDKLKANFVVNYVRTDAENRNATGYDNTNPMQAFTQWWQSQLDVERLKERQNLLSGGQYTWNLTGISTDRTNNNQLTGIDFDPNYFDNPYWVRNNYLQEDFKNRLYGNVNLSYALTEELSITTQFGTDWYQFSLREGIPDGSVAGSNYTETERQFQETNMEVRLNYNTNFSEDWTFNAGIGANSMVNRSKRFTSTTNGGLVIDRFFNIANSAQDPTTDTYERKKGINSIFGLASFGWKDMLFLDLTARNDWSSILPEDNNSYFYPSASMSFVLTELNGLNQSNFLNFAKIRASIAQVGNDGDPYSLYDVYNPINPNFDGNPLYSVPNQRQNPNLTNELTTEYEFGVFAKFFGGRLSVDAAYYNRLTEDQIFPVDASATTGYSAVYLNAGSMRNSGVELQLNGTPIRTENFSWNLGLNLTSQNNEVVELLKDENGESITESLIQGGTWAADLRVQEGKPYMALYGQDYIYDDNGNKVIGDNGYYKFTEDRVYLGSAIADWIGGFNTSFNYKNLTLSALFDFQVGGIIHSTSLQWSKYSGMHPETVSFNGEADTRENGMVLPGVLENGSTNDIRIDPQTYYQTTWRVAAPNVYDASYLKFREIRLNYSLPQRFLGRSAISNVDFSVFGRNLAILSADLPYLDPQVVTGSGNVQGLENAQVPSTRSFGLNVSVKF